VKRSRRIRLVLMGGLSAGLATGCGPSASTKGPVSAGNVYTNNHFLPGVGHYHAPFRNWYAWPYNHFDPQLQRYYAGGLWTGTPHRSITNLSEPTPQAAQAAQERRTDVPRGGFGSTSRQHSIWA
jgi:hypothetical protein